MKKAIVFGFHFLVGVCVLGQTVLKGDVVSVGGEAIIGANVSMMGTYDGGSSDVGGAFSFTSSAIGKHVLLVTFMGYDTVRQEVILSGGGCCGSDEVWRGIFEGALG